MLKALAAALFLMAATPSMAADLPTYPFIHVSAAANLNVMPDIGEIDFEIVSEDADPETAWKLVVERLDAGKALFAQFGVAAQDVSVQDITRRYRKLPDGSTGALETRCAVHVTVRDLKNWTPLVQQLMAMRNLESFAVAFSRSDREQIEADLLKEALAAARVKGQIVAKGIGARLGAANGVSMGALKNLSNSMGLATEGQTYRDVAPNPPDMTLVAAQRYVQGVDVVYRIGK